MRPERGLGWLGVLALSIVYLSSPAAVADEKWMAEAIADAVRAAPHAVTDHATIYGWSSDGKLKLARDGTGPYTCVASGAFSVRVGKPPLPYPDPMCMDQNAWAFLQAVWSEQNPLKPEKPYPTAPGLVWMLAGMNVNKGAVVVGDTNLSIVKAATEGSAEGVMQMTPHVMIMPMPINRDRASMSTKYDPGAPLNAWVMAADTPYEHLMVHFSKEDAAAMMQGSN